MKLDADIGLYLDSQVPAGFLNVGPVEHLEVRMFVSWEGDHDHDELMERLLRQLQRVVRDHDKTDVTDLQIGIEPGVTLGEISGFRMIAAGTARVLEKK